LARSNRDETSERPNTAGRPASLEWEISPIVVVEESLGRAELD